MPRSVNVINTASIKLLMGDIMDISKILLTLLAIFCVIASAGVACAADAYDDIGYDKLCYADDIGVWVDGQYGEDNQTGLAGSQYNETFENAAAGEPVSDSVSENMIINETSSNTLLEAGNPILELFSLTAVLGGFTFFKRD